MQSIRSDISDLNRRRVALNRLENLTKFASPNATISSIQAKSDTPNQLQQNLVVELMARQGAEFRLAFFARFFFLLLWNNGKLLKFSTAVLNREGAGNLGARNYLYFKIRS